MRILILIYLIRAISISLDNTKVANIVSNIYFLFQLNKLNNNFIN